MNTPPLRQVTLTSFGTASFGISDGTFRVVIDPYVEAEPHARAWLRETQGSISLILVSHEHWEHFDEGLTVDLAREMNGVVVGPRRLVNKLRKRHEDLRTLEMEPAGPGEQFHAETPRMLITAIRSRHGANHNSYRVDMDGFRFFHDGDNEDTRLLEPEWLERLDALLIAPWQGSGWCDLVETVQPRFWYAMHLEPSELDEHERGEFFPRICSRLPLPDRLVVLRPGQRHTIDVEAMA